MTAQKMYSRTNQVQASETPNAMTVAQIDQALRDFVLQDTAHLRRDAETAYQVLRGESRKARRRWFRSSFGRWRVPL
jgi:hypothetical protein